MKLLKRNINLRLNLTIFDYKFYILNIFFFGIRFLMIYKHRRVLGIKILRNYFAGFKF